MEGGSYELAIIEAGLRQGNPGRVRPEDALCGNGRGEKTGVYAYVEIISVRRIGGIAVKGRVLLVNGIIVKIK